jgi:hypothetical protein
VGLGVGVGGLGVGPGGVGVGGTGASQSFKAFCASEKNDFKAAFVALLLY